MADMQNSGYCPTWADGVTVGAHRAATIKRKPTIYYAAGIPATLIPVQFIAWARTPAHDITGGYNAVVKLKRAAPGYQRGELLHVWAGYVVVKAGRRDYRQIMRSAELPKRTESNTIAARV